MKSLLSIVAVLLLASCVSNKTREEAGMPAALLAWGTPEMGVRSDIERGIADAVEDGNIGNPSIYLDDVVSLDTALRAPIYSQLQFAAIPWLSLKEFGERGIQDRVDDLEMSDMVAESLRERLRNFDELMVRLRTAHFVFIAPGTEPRVYPSETVRTKEVVR